MATPGARIYTGPWINWSEGPIKGSTLTLTARDGAFLTAFLALFVGITGGQLWKIMSYTLHQIRATREARDGMHHQQQAILRNTTSPAAAVWELGRMSIFWRNHARAPFFRNLPIAFLAILNLGLFAAAGLYSSQVSKAAGTDVLIRGAHCGYWNVTGGPESPLGMVGMSAKSLNDTITAATYSRRCYGDSRNELQCNNFVKRQIDFKTNENAACPFDKKMCKISPTSAYEMDTGPVDSHTVLGINAPQKNRITYRHVSSCSPLNYSRFVGIEFENKTNPSSYLIQKINLGPARPENYTFSYKTRAAQDGFRYELAPIMHSTGVKDDYWEPVPELRRTDADVVAFFFTPNGVSYQKRVDDPFFAATEERSFDLLANGQNITFYPPDNYVSVLGCIDQHQYCNPNKPGPKGEKEWCTPLTSGYYVFDEITKIGYNKRQEVTAQRLGAYLSVQGIYRSVAGRGASALRAAESLYDYQQGPLPNNQWQIEVNSWFSTALAKLQALAIEYATGPQYLPEGTYVADPETQEERDMCKAQKIRTATGHMNFSILGIAIIIVVCFFITLISLVADTFVGFLQRKMRKGHHARLQWILDEKHQLQRMAYEEAGMGNWTGGTNSVPVARKGDLFKMPENVDESHPRLGVNRGRPASYESAGLLGHQGHVEKVQSHVGQSEVYSPGPSPLPSPRPY